MKYALKLSEDCRVLSACEILPNGKYSGMPVVNKLPDGDVSDYLYKNGGFVYDPLPKPEAKPSQLDIIEAQVTYTAMMTDTLIEG